MQTERSYRQCAVSLVTPKFIFIVLTLFIFVISTFTTSSIVFAQTADSEGNAASSVSQYYNLEYLGPLPLLLPDVNPANILVGRSASTWDRSFINPNNTYEPLVGELLKSTGPNKDPVLQNQYQKAVTSAQESSTHYRECTDTFKFDDQGNEDILNTALGTFKRNILGANESVLKSLLAAGLETDLELQFGVRIEKYYTEETYPKKVGNKTVNRTITETHYRIEDVGSISPTVHLDLVDKVKDIGVKISSNLKNAADHCANYSNEALNAVNYLTTGANDAIMKWNSAYKNLSDNYSDAQYMGMCDENYSGAGKEACMRLRELMAEANLGTKDIPADYTYLLNKIEEVKGNLSDDYIIHSSNLIDIMKEAESFYTRVPPAIAAYEKAKLDAISSLNTSVNQHEAQLDKNVKAQLEWCATNDCQLINATVASGSVTNMKSIDEKYKELQVRYNNGKLFSKIIDDLLTNKPEDWLLSAYKEDQALAKAAAVDYNVSEEVSIVLNQTRLSCIKAIEGLKRKHYDVSELEMEFNNAEKETSAGKKYRDYLAIMLHVKEMGETTPKDKDAFDKAEATFKDLLARAKSDGIDTTFESERYNKIINDDGTYAEMIAELNNLKASLLDKAERKYASLYTYKDKIHSTMAKFPNVLGDLSQEVNIKEEGYFDENGVLKTEEKLGELHILKAFYERVWQTIETKMSTLKSYLKVSVDLNIPTAEAGQNATIRGEVCIKNPYGWNFTDVEENVYTGFPINSLEAKGDGSVSERPSGFKWSLATIKAYDSDCVDVNKELTPIKIESVSEKVYGVGQEGTIEKTYKVDVSTKTYWQPSGAKSFVNGVERSPPVFLEPGTYTLKEVSSAKIAEVNVTPVITKLDNTYIYTYTIKVTPLYNIDELKIYDYRAQSTTQLTHEGNYYVLNNLEKGVSVTLTLKKTKEDLSQDINETLTYLKAQNLTTQEQARVDEAEKLIASGQDSSALQTLKQVQEEVNKRLEEEAENNKKFQEVKTEFNNTLSQISQAIKEAQGTPLQGELEEELNKLKGLENASPNTLVNSFDKKWRQRYVTETAKQLWTEYTQAKKTLVKEGLDDDVNTSKAIESFESAYRGAKSSYSIPKLVQAAKAVESVKKAADNVEKKKAQLKETFDDKLSSVNKLLDKYKQMEKMAKKYGLADYIGLSSSYFQKEISQYSKPKTAKQYEEYTASLEEVSDELNREISALNESAKEEIARAQTFLDNRKIPKEAYEKSVEGAEKAIKEGNPIEALHLAKQLEASALNYKPKIPMKKEEMPLSLIAIGAAGALALGYLYKDQIIPKPKKKEMRRIPRYKSFVPKKAQDNQTKGSTTSVEKHEKDAVVEKEAKESEEKNASKTENKEGDEKRK